MAAPAIFNHFEMRVWELRGALEEAVRNGDADLRVAAMDAVAVKIRSLRIEVDNYPRLTNHKKAMLQNAIDMTCVSYDYDKYGIQLGVPGYDQDAVRRQRFRTVVERDRLSQEREKLENSCCVIL